jgi:hypothetical protein
VHNRPTRTRSGGFAPIAHWVDVRPVVDAAGHLNSQQKTRIYRDWACRCDPDSSGYTYLTESSDVGNLVLQ